VDKQNPAVGGSGVLPISALWAAGAWGESRPTEVFASRRLRARDQRQRDFAALHAVIGFDARWTIMRLQFERSDGVEAWTLTPDRVVTVGVEQN
jgi:hypothetical protein